MKDLALVALAIFVGFLLGGVPARAELEAVRAELMELRRENESFGRDLSRMLQVGAGPSKPATPPQAASPASPVAPDEPVDEGGGDPAGGPEDPPLEPVVPGELALPENVPADELAAARAALELRRAQARASLVENANPTDDQLLAIDDAVTGMNDTLLDLADELSARAEAGQPLTRRDAMSFAADALDAMIGAEDALHDALHEDQRAAADDASLDPFSYVDPAVLDALERLGP